MESSYEDTLLHSCLGIIGLRKQASHNEQWHYIIAGVLLPVFLLFLTTSCQLTQSAFARTTNNAGAAFAAASQTLNYAHHGKVTAAYARSAFAAYQNELSGLDQQLPLQAGAPDAASVHQLLSVYAQAMQVVNQPCLDTSCAWRPQIATLNRASEAFLKVGG
ncbi:MAG: hypothetical protein JO215_09200 [Ktedonobacteraceae bacterium]|nr:hypothetical protein [Ktedonobacteraceae bacterium]